MAHNFNRCSLVFLAAAVLVPSIASAQNGSWTQPASGMVWNWSDTGNWSGGIVADGANNTAAFATAGLTGNLVINLDTARTIGALVFDNPTNGFGWTIQGASALTLSNSGGPTIAVNKANITVTISVPMVGSFTKTGEGTLILTGTNTNTGGTSIMDGTLAVASDSSLGAGPVTLSALGTLSYIANASTSRSFTLGGGTLSVKAATTLTINGGNIVNGYLDGSGTFATDPVNGARFSSVVSVASISITSNSANDRFVNFTNGGKLNVAVNLPPPPAVTWNGFTNQGSGTITLGGGSQVTAANFQTFGLINIAPAVVGSSQFTLLTNVGASPLSFGAGSRTFVGTPETAGPPTNPNFVAGLDLHGQDAVLAGSLFANNGFVADSVGGGRILVGGGALYKGVGVTFVPIITQGGRVQAGDCPGISAFGSLTIGSGAVNSVVWQINDAKASSEPTPDANNNVSGWSQLRASKATDPLTGRVSTGDLTWTATPGSQFRFSLETLLNPTPLGTDNPGPMANFDATQPFAWPVITYQGIYSGPTDSATLTADTLIDTSLFANQINGTFSIQLDQTNKAMNLVYTPVPEPGTLVLVGFAAAGLAIRRRRRT